LTDEQKIAEVELTLDGLIDQARESFKSATCALWNEFSYGARTSHGGFEIAAAAEFEERLDAMVGVSRTREIVLQEYKNIGEWFCQCHGVAPEDWHVFMHGTDQEKEAVSHRLQMKNRYGITV